MCSSRSQERRPLQPTLYFNGWMAAWRLLEGARQAHMFCLWFKLNRHSASHVNALELLIQVISPSLRCHAHFHYEEFPVPFSMASLSRASSCFWHFPLPLRAKILCFAAFTKMLVLQHIFHFWSNFLHVFFIKIVYSTRWSSLEINMERNKFEMTLNSHNIQKQSRILSLLGMKYWFFPS